MAVLLRQVKYIVGYLFIYYFYFIMIHLLLHIYRYHFSIQGCINEHDVEKGTILQGRQLSNF